MRVTRVVREENVMDIQTTFNLGQKVHSIKEESTKVWARCGFCMGSDGPISILDRTEVTGLDGETRTCPACHGRGGEQKHIGKIWVLGDLLNIGQVEVRISKTKTIENYMCRETGIGSGRVWGLDKLFPTSKAALAECNIRNSTA